jgi:hypothetical protein
VHTYIIMAGRIFIYENSIRKLRTMSKTMYGGGFTCWAPFGLIQFYFLFSGREFAGIRGRNGGRDNY